jgi:hypothetical protein
VRVSGLRVWRVGLCGDLAEEAQYPGLVAALLLPVREVEGASGDRQRVVPPAGQEVRLPEVGEEERVVGRTRRRGVSQGFFHEGHALGKATRQHIRVPEVPGRDVDEASGLGIPALLEGSLELGEGLGNVALTERHEPEAPVGEDEAVVMIDLAGDAGSLLAAGRRFGELAQLGQAPGKPLP